MLKRIINWFSSSEDEHLNAAPHDAVGKWALTYDGLIIGELTVANGEWEFKYSQMYKQLDKNLLIDFPDKNKVYRSKFLWPFFAHRIPGLGQPKVQKIIQKERLDKNEVDLLKRFGQRSITNPFELKILT